VAPTRSTRARARKLLDIALRRGGDAADLFAEFSLGASMVLDEGIVKSASRGVGMGVGMRVLRGVAAGYAYTEDLEWEALARTAETAAQIASGDPRAAVEVTARAHPDRYPSPTSRCSPAAPSSATSSSAPTTPRARPTPA
jgi:TldD protein